ncbi:GNAT family N-acetyltransferase [Actinacidiphila yeochonensis]|uniref:GNAT family N-acetyltransferase n=1 Tax=Actinacidiphila yeochonensis TaxID=89050 RepID=UPI0005614091|nr:GNAT family N-acetyltransferase [Actinacidiphila yeochonensis]
MPPNPSPLGAPSADDLSAWHRVWTAASSHDRPGEPLPSPASVRRALTAAGEDSRQLLWLVRRPGGDPTATAALRLPASDRVPTAGLDLVVHPAHRRMGTGSRLLATATEAAAAEGCAGVTAEVPAGAPGEDFLATRGFVPVQRLTWQRLALCEVPERVVKLPDVPHPGYRLSVWEGPPPPALAAGFAAARGTLGGGPRGDAGRHAPHLGEHDTAEAAARRGERLLTVAALADPDGAVAGYTRLVLPAEAAEPARQLDTAVLPGHRGNGLGLWLKAAMLRRVRGDHPAVAEITTGTADDNRHMHALNAALGYRPLRRTVAYRLALRR